MAKQPNFNEEFRNDAAFQAAALGIDIENFIYEDRIGVYLMAKAERVKQETIAALAVCDPEDNKSIQQLQWQYTIPDLVERWLREAIAEGKVAERNIELEEMANR